MSLADLLSNITEIKRKYENNRGDREKIKANIAFLKEESDSIDQVLSETLHLNQINQEKIIQLKVSIQQLHVRIMSLNSLSDSHATILNALASEKQLLISEKRKTRDAIRKQLHLDDIR